MHFNFFGLHASQYETAGIPGGLILLPMFAAHPYNHFCTEYPHGMPCHSLSTTGYTRKSGIIILLYFVLTSPHSSITTLLVNFGRSFSFRSTTISYTDFVSLVPSDKRCYVGRNDRYEVGVRDKKHENLLPLDLHGVKFEQISRIFDPTF